MHQKQNSNLVYSICSKYQGYNDKEDLHQVGMIGLINAYKNFDSTKVLLFHLNYKCLKPRT